MADYLYSPAIDSTPVDLGSILWANRRTLIYHTPDPPSVSPFVPPLLTRPSSSNFFLKRHFYLPFTRPDLTLNISFIELKSKRLLQRLIKQCDFAQKACVNTERVPPGNPIILLKFNKFNMATVLVKRLSLRSHHLQPLQTPHEI